MTEATGRILKSTDVELGGNYKLDLAPDESGSLELASAPVAPVATVEPKVRIVENNPDHAVIEVTCSCGTKMCVRCEYSNDAAQ